MAEGDVQCTYLTYARNALRIYFQNRSDVYVAGNLQDLRMDTSSRLWSEEEIIEYSFSISSSNG